MLGTLAGYYDNHNANIRSGVCRLAEGAVVLFKEAREKAVCSDSVPDSRGLIFTCGTTESINLVAYAWSRPNLKRVLPAARRNLGPLAYLLQIW